MYPDDMFQSVVDTANENFEGYSVSKEYVTAEGRDMELDFHWVGRNATHHFAIAQLDDGRVVLLSSEWGDDEEITHIQVYKLGDFPTYIGHW